MHNMDLTPPHDRNRGRQRTSKVISPLSRAVILGVMGFATGYIGPLRYSMAQGPLLGIFVTGPVSFAVGLGLGWFLNRRRMGAVVREGIFVCAAIGVVVMSGIASRPRRQIVGTLIDGKVTACHSPIFNIPAAVGHWRQVLAQNPSLTPRTAWERTIKDILTNSDGVVLQFTTDRLKHLYTDGAKATGNVVSGEWKAEPWVASYFALFAGPDCTRYPIGRRVTLFVGRSNDREEDGVPPGNAAGVLELETVRPAPSWARDLSH